MGGAADGFRCGGAGGEQRAGADGGGRVHGGLWCEPDSQPAGARLLALPAGGHHGGALREDPPAARPRGAIQAGDAHQLRRPRGCVAYAP
eukprot:2791804-Pyramimonas_sp.AAC.1